MHCVKDMSVTLNVYLRGVVHRVLAKRMKMEITVGGRKSEPDALGTGGREDSDLLKIMMMEMRVVRMVMKLMEREDSDQGKSKLQ